MSQIRPIRIGAGEGGPIQPATLLNCHTIRTMLPPTVSDQTIGDSAARSAGVSRRAVWKRISPPATRTTQNAALDHCHSCEPDADKLSATRGRVDAKAALSAHVRRLSVRNLSTGGMTFPRLESATAIPENPAMAVAISVIMAKSPAFIVPQAPVSLRKLTIHSTCLRESENCMGAWSRLSDLYRQV